jgi:hypothetical protein
MLVEQHCSIPATVLSQRTWRIAALGAHWVELGFEHFKSGVWVLDLSAITFQERWTS